MKDGKPNDEGERQGRSASGGRSRGGGATRKRSFVERATARGHSGYGSESVRPYLRDQLRLKSLLPRGYVSPEDTLPGKDEHHR